MVLSVSSILVGVLALSSFDVFASVHAEAEAAATTFEAWKQTAYFEEAFNKGFLPPSAYKHKVSTDKSSGDGGEFTMGANGAGSSTETDAVAEQKKRFEAALKTVASLKEQHPQAQFSINTPFALLTADEFLAYVNRNNVNPDIMFQDSSNSTAPMTKASTNPGSSSSADGGPKTKAAAAGESVDWQSYGCVTEVKDQAQCGACWAFSATAAMESGVCVQTNQKSLPVLADQQLISCDNQGQSIGCGGGYASYTMEWIAKNRSGKMCSLATYPFTSSSGTVAECTMGGCSEIDIGVTGYESLRQNPDQMEDKVRERPISAFLYSGSSAFQYYKGGILTGENCDSSGDHSALVVGFGEESGLKYWRLKNQWGTKWGESGYVRIQRRFGNADGACGVEKYASWPTFKTNLVVDAPNPNFTPSAPVPAPQPVTDAPTPAPEPVTDAPTPAPEPVPTPAPEPVLTPAPEPVQTPAPEPAQTPAPEPVTDAPTPTEAPVTQAPSSPAPTPAATTPAPVPTPSITDNSSPAQTPAVPTPTPSATNNNSPAQNPVVPTPTPSKTTPTNQEQRETATPAPAVGSDADASGDAGQCGRLDEGVDYLGNDIKDVEAASVTDCCALCHATEGCNAFTFTNYKEGRCFLKSRAGLVVPNSGAVSSSLQDISKCTNQNTPQEVGYDYPGFDIAEEKASAAEDCYELCANSADCNAFTWSAKDSGCKLKTRKVPAAEYKQSEAGDFSSAIVYKCQKAELNTDYEGNDIANAPARSPEACCAICKLTEGCKAYSWNDFKSGTCWLKSAASTGVAKGGVVSASL